MINKHIGIQDCWCKNELFYKGNSFWFVFFLKGGCTCTRGTPPGYGLEIINNEKKNVLIVLGLHKNGKGHDLEHRCLVRRQLVTGSPTLFHNIEKKVKLIHVPVYCFNYALCTLSGPQPGIRKGGCKIIGRRVWGPLKAQRGVHMHLWHPPLPRPRL